MFRFSEEAILKFEDALFQLLDNRGMELEYSPKDLRDRGFYGRFQYLVMDYEQIYVTMPKDTFRSFEYYLGMEYDNDRIVFRLEGEDKIHVIYEDSDRLFSILDL